MKKITALVLSVLMVFSTLSISVIATDEQTTQTIGTYEYDSITGKSYDDDGETGISIIDLFHNFIGNILAIFGIECPFCDMIHGESEADAYYRNNSDLIDVIDVDEADSLMSEEEVKDFLEGRGFFDAVITYEHSVNGDYLDETEISENSSVQHPMYQMLYLSAADEVWAIYVINDEIFANPVSFNLESDLGVQLVVTENETLTSYDNEANRFYITMPYDSEVLSMYTYEITAETLDELIVDEICAMTGATLPENNEDDTDNDIELLSNSSEISYSYGKEYEISTQAEMADVSSPANDPMIVVSMGDSYSAGEGIEKFYGQDKDVYEKVKCHDWLAHRSTKSWPGLLEIPGINGTMKDYKAPLDGSSTRDCQWYFVAASGAETKHFNSSFKKEYDQDIDGFWDLKDSENLPPQLDVFNSITGDVDYVTLTIGGNDVGFSDIIETCVINCAYLRFGFFSKLEETFNKLWRDFDTTEKKLRKAYRDVAEAAGSQAEIIVAGYPQLLDSDGKGAAINWYEANLINLNVSLFNNRIEEIIADMSNICADNPINIHFVDVEGEFAGNEAYSDDPWINKVIMPAKDEDLDHDGISSSYSIHPNEEGAKAYARCVNAKIEEIENIKNRGILSGKICQAANKNVAITDAYVTMKNSYFDSGCRADIDGMYSIELPTGVYQVTVKADGYIDFNAYAVVEKDQTTYMETFLLVEGDAGETGTAVGTVSNALNGAGIGGVTLQIRNGWNNSTEGSVIKTVTTDSSGRYNVTLPIGNYTLYASKDGYVSTMINIIVQGDTSSEKNGSMTPVVSGDSFRIVLTWGYDPNDLDSHVVGTLGNGNGFHVYFSDKSEYDGSTEVCNLDIDDTSGYGPETITLNTTTDNPYYYYVYKYAGSGSIATSGAQVKVYQGDRLVATFNAPTDQGNGAYWNVFAIENGRMIVKNTIASSPDTTY